MNLRFVFSLIVSLLSLLPAAAQDLTRNWIRERIFLDAEGKKCVTSVQYFDGIGRETLLLTDGLSPAGGVAGALTGESFAGRTSAKWLPATGLTGFDFLTPERVKSLAVSSHEGDSVPFSLTRRDALGRVSSVRNAGGDLVGKAKYRFFVRDRLGSVRSVADEDGNVLQQNLYYARGGAWGDVCTAPGFQSYKYCGKYLDRKHGLDLYDYGARLYDPAAAFWTSPDPLCEKYYNISPYAFCNNNPVTFIDPDGRKWKTLEDKEKATRIQEISMFHVRSLEKAIQKIKRKIEVANSDISLSEKARNRKIKRYKENLSELQYKKNLLSHLHDGISILENSSQTYAYKRIYNGIASIVWDGNTIYIENFGTIGSYAHETVHAIQRERGFIIFKEGKAFANMLEFFEIEKEAYQTEYSITNGLIPYSETSTPTNIFGITPKWFRGLKFNGTDVY